VTTTIKIQQIMGAGQGLPDAFEWTSSNFSGKSRVADANLKIVAPHFAFLSIVSHT
jgi:hypothetical protein